MPVCMWARELYIYKYQPLFLHRNKRNCSSILDTESHTVLATKFIWHGAFQITITKTLNLFNVFREEYQSIHIFNIILMLKIIMCALYVCFNRFRLFTQIKIWISLLLYFMYLCVDIIRQFSFRQYSSLRLYWRRSKWVILTRTFVLYDELKLLSL